MIEPHSQAIKLKASLVSTDGGETWVVIRQFYAADARQQDVLLPLKFLGTRLRTIGREQFDDNEV
jgi:hypothetical protein